MTTRILFPLVSTLVLAAASCTVEDVDSESTVGDRSAALDPASPAPPISTYYIVTHIDTRKCKFPICGGVFVQEVNKELTQCADGSYAKECHVAVTDYSALGLDKDLEAKLDDHWNKGQALLRGELFQDVNPLKLSPYPPIDTLAASEGWVGVTGNSPKGAFQRLDDSGIVCVTFPCESFVERLLNVGLTNLIAEVDLAHSGATPEQIDAGFAELFETGILAVGEDTTVYGPAGSALGFAANEFYTRIDGPYKGEPCGPSVCGGGQECCNPLCGFCTFPGEACLMGCAGPVATE
jgi:hypothetical protein